MLACKKAQVSPQASAEGAEVTAQLEEAAKLAENKKKRKVLRLALPSQAGRRGARRGTEGPGPEEEPHRAASSEMHNYSGGWASTLRCRV